jgi:plasmid stability protein
MKTTLELPDDLMRTIKVRAAQSNRRMKDVVAELLEKGMRAPANETPLHGSVSSGNPSEISPETGLPVIHSPEDAPIATMSDQEIHALIHQAQEREDTDRFRRGLSG